MDNFLFILSTSWDSPSLAILLPRLAVGIFFAISGYHKLFNSARHANLVSTLQHDGIRWVRFNQWWVPGVELVAGVFLALGFLSSLSALALLVICLVASWCEAKAKVARYSPIDSCDVVDDYLYLPEVIYGTILAGLLFGGPGSISLDYLIWPPATISLPISLTT